MRSIWIACVSLLTALVHSAPDGQLHIIHDNGPKDHSSPMTITPEALRLILASNIGVDRYHDLDNVSPEDLAAVNTYADTPRLFDKSVRRPLALLHLQHADPLTIDSVTKNTHHQELTVANLPSDAHTESLLADLAVQAMATHGASTSAVDAVGMLRSGGTLSTDRLTIRTLSPGSFTPTSLSEIIKYHVDRDYNVMIYSTPKVQSSTSFYGSWTMPRPITKRQYKEEPLEPPTSSTTSSSPSRSSSANYDQSKPLRGILPQCYSSMSLCQSNTRNCTGHGKCTLKYTDKDASDAGRPCFSCQCTAHVRTNADGTKKTTRYGGPACQKKDIVAPFWLLAGFSVVMVSLVTWGIGTIWTMGDEQLPSVIGAGVSGVPRRN